MGVLPVRLSLYHVPDVHGGQKRASDSLNWSYRLLLAVLWVLGIKPTSSVWVALLIAEPSLQPST